ncbi:olfactory receptor 10A6-like [Spea bombifrons]|uniref:olfactory receptor 10A6-like n=1 Tax=Spea bombifrons TaxID=233779 RepID=UPI00234A6F27|nr:olfactory receptor 10A6-like [Spea bombifrons]
MNQTKVVVIIMLGFQNPEIFNSVLFVLFLAIYILTLVGNLLIIVLVAKFQRLKSPMYFFLTQLSACDIFLSTIIVPNMLHGIMAGGSLIFVSGCITQLYFYSVSEGAECFLLTVMSYDRYLAICHPLRYTSIMDFRLYFQLIVFSWLLACILTFIMLPPLSSLQFCGHVIDHYFCDLAPLVELSCTKHTLAEFLNFILGVPSLTVPFSLVIFTYISIFITILGISSSTGRQKAFSTCSSHLTVVCVYYGTLITIYLAPTKGDLLLKSILTAHKGVIRNSPSNSPYREGCFSTVRSQTEIIQGMARHGSLDRCMSRDISHTTLTRLMRG